MRRKINGLNVCNCSFRLAPALRQRQDLLMLSHLLNGGAAGGAMAPHGGPAASCCSAAEDESHLWLHVLRPRRWGLHCAGTSLSSLADYFLDLPKKKKMWGFLPFLPWTLQRSLRLKHFHLNWWWPDLWALLRRIINFMHMTSFTITARADWRSSLRIWSHQ